MSCDAAIKLVRRREVVGGYSTPSRAFEHNDAAAIQRKERKKQKRDLLPEVDPHNDHQKTTELPLGTSSGGSGVCLVENENETRNKIYIQKNVSDARSK